MHIKHWAQAVWTAGSLLTVPPAYGDTLSVPLERHGAGYYVPVSINGHADRCLLDTGADVLMLPIAWELDPRWHVGFQPTTYARMDTADGTVTTVPEGNLPTITLGNAVTLSNVKSIVGSGKECLLGQSVLARFAAVTIDYISHRLLLVRQ